MKSVAITEDNIGEYAPYLGEDMAENFGREFIRGLALEDVENECIKAALVWELHDSERENMYTGADILFLKYEDLEAADEIISSFENDVWKEQIKICFAEISASDEEIAKILEEHGFEINKEKSRDIYVRLSDIANLQAFQKAAASYVIPVKDLEIRQFREGIEYCLSHGRRAAVEDLRYLPMDWFDQDVSCCVRSEENISGFLLFHMTPSGVLFPQLICSSSQNARAELANMMRFSLENALCIYPFDTKMLIRRNKSEVKDLADMLFGDYSGDDIFLVEKTF